PFRARAPSGQSQPPNRASERRRDSHLQLGGTTMRSRARLGLVVLTLTAVVGAVGVSAGLRAKPERPAAAPLQLKAPTSIAQAIWLQTWVAFQRGFFQKNHIKVDLVTVPGTTALLLASLESGQINIWANGLVGVGGAAQQGHPTQYFCGTMNKQ